MIPRVGTRVRIIGVMPNDPAPMEVGAEGTVTGGQESAYGLPGQIYVEWDNGRTLILLETDPYRIVS